MRSYKGKIKKKITIKLIGDAEKAFNDLNRIVVPLPHIGSTKI